MSQISAINQNQSLKTNQQATSAATSNIDTLSKALTHNDAKAITLSPQPFHITLDTPTDWPSVYATFFVGVTGALVALAVGAMALIGQRNQVRSATANFRQDWQKELRLQVAKFISAIAQIHYELDANLNYIGSPESRSTMSQLMETHSTIELMLDRTKPYSKEISKLMEDLIEAVLKKETKKLDELGNNLLEVANGVLEQTWRDIRNDLKGK